MVVLESLNSSVIDPGLKSIRNEPYAGAASMFSVIDPGLKSIRNNEDGPTWRQGV